MYLYTYKYFILNRIICPRTDASIFNYYMLLIHEVSVWCGPTIMEWSLSPGCCRCVGGVRLSDTSSALATISESHSHNNPHTTSNKYAVVVLIR